MDLKKDNIDKKSAPDDGSVNEIATKVAHHPEPVIHSNKAVHLGGMINDGQVKKRARD